VRAARNRAFRAVGLVRDLGYWSRFSDASPMRGFQESASATTGANKSRSRFKTLCFRMVGLPRVPIALSCGT
jgi:hypothetical protein